MDYGRGKIRRIQFGAKVFLNKEKMAILKLQNTEGKPIGLNLIFRRPPLPKKSFEYLLRFKKEGRAKGIEFKGTLHF